ncbi:MAG: dihydropteroate synthase [Candidatus Omnitrophica bacterium CG11_big_fil_rev_8_21_14_0_20_64_10]|nr:MAG: dihydropteroate synthase [Candidatus Omnitrophica bacterium CG11_big_fil_rev_8_21_14_0_20_64_10]
MGILNVTPDSFSDGGRFLDPERACRRALRMQQAGADLIDIGGESTRPGARAVSVGTELKRVVPVIRRLGRRLKIPISVDTSKPEVAEAALAAGASLVNDVTALSSRRMARVVAGAGVPVILMHMRGSPRTMRKRVRYHHLIREVQAELRQAIRRALAAGIRKDRILLDPGIGFGKRLEHNLELIRELGAFRKLGYPLLLGPSRKSFIGQLLDQPVSGRLMGTAAAVALGVAHGADILRVHDVEAMRQVIDLAYAIETGDAARR